MTKKYYSLRENVVHLESYNPTQWTYEIHLNELASRHESDTEEVRISHTP